MSLAQTWEVPPFESTVTMDLFQIKGSGAGHVEHEEYMRRIAGRWISEIDIQGACYGCWLYLFNPSGRTSVAGTTIIRQHQCPSSYDTNSCRSIRRSRSV